MIGRGKEMADISAVIAPAWTRLESFRGRPFNSWGGAGGGWFRKKKIPASAWRKKQNACSTNVIESLWGKKREKNILPIILLEKKESLRFEDKGDYEGEFFPILSSAHARTNVILAGEFGSRRQSTTSFSEKVLVAKTSYQMIEILLFSGRERALSLSMKISVPTFVVKKSTMKLCGVSILRE